MTHAQVALPVRVLGIAPRQRIDDPQTRLVTALRTRQIALLPQHFAKLVFTHTQVALPARVIGIARRQRVADPQARLVTLLRTGQIALCLQHIAQPVLNDTALALPFGAVLFRCGHPQQPSLNQAQQGRAFAQPAQRFQPVVMDVQQVLRQRLPSLRRQLGLQQCLGMDEGLHGQVGGEFGLQLPVGPVHQPLQQFAALVFLQINGQRLGEMVAQRVIEAPMVGQDIQVQQPTLHALAERGRLGVRRQAGGGTHRGQRERRVREQAGSGQRTAGAGVQQAHAAQEQPLQCVARVLGVVQRARRLLAQLLDQPLRRDASLLEQAAGPGQGQRMARQQRRQGCTRLGIRRPRRVGGEVFQQMVRFVFLQRLTQHDVCGGRGGCRPGQPQQAALPLQRIQQAAPVRTLRAVGARPTVGLFAAFHDQQQVTAAAGLAGADVVGLVQQKIVAAHRFGDLPPGHPGLVFLRVEIDVDDAVRKRGVREPPPGPLAQRPAKGFGGQRGLAQTGGTGHHGHALAAEARHQRLHFLFAAEKARGCAGKLAGSDGAVRRL